MEYRGYVHKERRPGGVWIAVFGQVDNDYRTIVELVACPTQVAAFVWAIEKVREAYETISVDTGKKNSHAVQLPRHCLWCGRLIRFQDKVTGFCPGHRTKMRRNRRNLPYDATRCSKPEKVTYLHRGTAILVARLMELDCYQCTDDGGLSGCNGYHLTSAKRGAIIAHTQRSGETKESLEEESEIHA